MEQSKIISVIGRKGVGKSIFSINLAAALNELGFDVSLVDGNHENPSLHSYLGGNISSLSIHDLENSEDIHFTDVIQIHSSGLKVLPAHQKENKISMGSYADLIDSLKEFSEVTIVDSSSSIDLMNKNIALADEVVIIENNLDAKAYKHVNDMIRLSKGKLKGIFLNQHEGFDSYKLNERLNHPVFDSFPHEENISESLYLKQPHAMIFPKSDFSKKIFSVAELIAR